MVGMHVKYEQVRWPCPTLILFLVQEPLLWRVTHAHLEFKNADFLDKPSWKKIYKKFQ
jgi:hypothetical protein